MIDRDASWTEARDRGRTVFIFLALAVGFAPLWMPARGGSQEPADATEIAQSEIIDESVERLLESLKALTGSGEGADGAVRWIRQEIEEARRELERLGGESERLQGELATHRARRGELERRLRALAAGMALIGIPAPLGSDAEADEAAGARFGPEEVAFYESKVRPILEANCYECHGGEEKIKSNFNLTTRAGLLKGGDRGAAVDLENPAASNLLQMLSYKDEQHQMPPTGQLSADQIEIVAEWIGNKAPWTPGKSIASEGEAVSTQAEARGADHWAFQPVRRPPVPPIEDVEWRGHPIDAFIFAGLLRRGLRPSAAADRQTQIRRAYYDLTGLPPAPEEVRAFEEDRSPDAYERVLDHLLASPRYGEKWGRHWSDLVRYADSNGYERDSDKPYIWRYRDYVIDAFNRDKPYDRFILEQIAGDELDDAGPEQIVATGFYRLGIWDDEPADRELSRYDTLDGIIDTTGRAFLGISMGCARCHDHRIDPILQSEYYQFLAFFRGMTDMRRDQDKLLKSLLTPFEQRTYDQKLSEKRARVKRLRGELTELEEILEKRLVEEEVDLEGFKLRTADIEELEKVLGEEEASEYERVRKALEAEKKREIEGRWAMAVSEIGPEPPETNILIRGNPHVPGERVEPGFPGALSPPPAVIEAAREGAATSGRRRVLAKWIASKENPLTARVMINRIWQHHFGRGIVRTSNDFGTQGTAPTHPELLDWLAAEFVERGWSLKALHRLIMTSRTYRMSSRGNAEGLAADPANDSLWRFDMRRLTAEEIRDSVLAVSGELNLKMGGPGFYPDLPEAVLATSSQAHNIWGKSPARETARRSIYIHVKRSLLTPMLTDFDLADTDASCPVRFVTTQPTQALGMLNGMFVSKQAKKFAERLRREAPGDRRRQVRRGLNLATSREPEAEEVQRALEFMNELEAEEGLSRDRALDRLCLLIYNLNEFIFLD